MLNIITKRMKKTKTLLLLLGIPAILCSFSTERNIYYPSEEERDILIRHSSSDWEGAPRSEATVIAFYDTDLSCVFASLSNAGTSVDVEFINGTTDEVYEYIIPGSGSSVMPISGSSGYWTVSFTLESGDVYYGVFII